jgi:hypothetical protein
VLSSIFSRIRTSGKCPPLALRDAATILSVGDPASARSTYGSKRDTERTGRMVSVSRTSYRRCGTQDTVEGGAADADAPREEQGPSPIWVAWGAPVS